MYFVVKPTVGETLTLKVDKDKFASFGQAMGFIRRQSFIRGNRGTVLLLLVISNLTNRAIIKYFL